MTQAMLIVAGVTANGYGRLQASLGAEKAVGGIPR
jgi:hypothetical protein